MKTLKNILTISLAVLVLNSCVLRSMAVISDADFKEKPTAEITINYEDTYGLIIVPIVIDGKTYRFIFDTGAGTTVVSKEISELKAFKKKGGIKVNDAVESSNKLAVGSIGEMTMGGFKYSKVGVVVNDFNTNEQFRCLRIDGIIGMNVLKLSNWKVDYENKTVTGYDQEHEMTVPENAYTFVFTNKAGSPFIELSVDNQSAEFLVDTGKNSELISVSSDIKLEGKKHMSVGQGSFGMFGKTEIDTTFYCQADFSDTTGFDLANITVTQTNKEQSNTGNGFYKKNYRYVLFDFKNRKMHCCEPKTARNLYASYGVSIMISGGNLVIGAKDLMWLEESDLIALQDTVVAVNGIRFENNNFCELVESFGIFRKERKPLTLVLIHEGIEKEVHLSMKEFTGSN